MTGSQTAVREAMNRLLGISKDKDVANIKVATEEEMDAYENGVIEVELEPMRPYFGSPRPTAWNSTNSFAVTFMVITTLTSITPSMYAIQTVFSTTALISSIVLYCW